jgi:general secretion pathway protein G
VRRPSESARKARRRGFTIIELVACLAILAVLSTLALPLAELAVKRQKETELRRALWELRDAIDAYKRAGDEGRIARDPSRSGYPPDLLTLVQGVSDAKTPQSGRVVYFLRRIPRDPFFEDASVPAHLTWGLRSYASPPDAPRPGEDVFDVYSMSAGVGVNGLPYGKW